METIKLILIIVILIIILLILALTIYDIKARQEKKREASKFFEEGDVIYEDDDPELQRQKATREFENMKLELLRKEAENQKRFKEEAAAKEKISAEPKIEVEKLKKPSLLDGLDVEKINATANKTELKVIKESSSPSKLVVNQAEEENIKKSTFSPVTITGEAKKEVPQAEDLRKTQEFFPEKLKESYTNNEPTRDEVIEIAIDKDKTLKEPSQEASLKNILHDEGLFDIVDRELEDLPEYADEEDLIISVEELERQADKKYEENEYTQYNDEETPISIDELYQTMNVPVKEIKDLSKYLPDFGKVDPIELEKTMNLNEVNEEIQKANDYLETLKDLKDSLRRRNN